VSFSTTCPHSTFLSSHCPSTCVLSLFSCRPIFLSASLPPVWLSVYLSFCTLVTSCLPVLLYTCVLLSTIPSVHLCPPACLSFCSLVSSCLPVLLYSCVLLSTFPSVYLCPPVYLSFCTLVSSCLNVLLYTCVFLSTCPSVYLFFLSTCPPVCLCPPVYLSTCVPGLLVISRISFHYFLELC
jgi:hypothetical protein